MKQIYFSTVLLIISISTYATIRTVSNTPSTLAQFSTIQAAVDASSSGDTVYVHGSPNAYASFTISGKQLVIIGPGWSPNKNLPFVATVAGCSITGAGSSNTEIQGLSFTTTVDMNTNHPDNLRFIRNSFTNHTIQVAAGGTTYIGYLFEGNLFNNAQLTGTTSSTYQNFLLQNNYFFENSCCVNGNIAGLFNSVNVLVTHNLWFGPGNSTRNCFSSNCRFLTIANNIFIRRDASNENSFSTFNNNITFNAGVNNPWATNNNVDAAGNVADQDPQMVDQTAVNAGTNNSLLDFTIATGPANNSGADGKDMGLLFDAAGSLNWTTSRTSRLPYIFSMNIINPTIPQAGTLQIQVEARKNN